MGRGKLGVGWGRELEKGTGNGLVYRQVVDAIPKAAEVDRGILGGAALLYLDFEDGVAVGLWSGDRDGEEQKAGDGHTGDTGPEAG